MEQNKNLIDEKLLEIARRARALSYSPYSGVSVGAALLTESGKVFVGANIENAAYSPTVCAERVAFFRAISEGQRKFKKIAVAGGKAGADSTKKFAPCGVCRQVMAEFCDGDFEIILEGKEGAEVYTLSTLLPEAFDKEKI